jgi:hypothetical protein
MTATKLATIIPILQLSIAPVILISGVGLLLLSMTNRLGRVVDRVRLLVREKKTATGEESFIIQSQLDILFRRAIIIRFSIAMAGMNILFDSLLIISIFVFSLLELDFALGIVLVFVLSLIFLIISIIAFLEDINMSLRAVKLELG